MKEFDLSKKRKELREFEKIDFQVPNLVKDILDIVEKQDKKFIRRLKDRYNDGDWESFGNEIDKLAGEKLK